MAASGWKRKRLLCEQRKTDSIIVRLASGERKQGPGVVWVARLRNQSTLAVAHQRRAANVEARQREIQISDELRRGTTSIPRGGT